MIQTTIAVALVVAVLIILAMRILIVRERRELTRRGQECLAMERAYLDQRGISFKALSNERILLKKKEFMIRWMKEQKIFRKFLLDSRHKELDEFVIKEQSIVDDLSE